MKKILIITHSNDNQCIPLVVQSLESRDAKVYRMDTDLYPPDVLLSLEETNQGFRHTFKLPGRDETVDFAEITALWYRRLYIGHGLPKDMDAELKKPTLQEAKTVFTAMLDSMDTFTMDPFHRVRFASHKQVQLQVARKVGLEIPKTLTTNNQEDVRAFFKTCETGMVTKMLSSFAVYDADNRENVVFTNPLTEKDLEDMEGLDLCPMTFQENIPKKLELRVTIVGDRVFTAAIDSQKSDKALSDWRRDGVKLLDAWQPYQLPKETESRLLKLMDDFKLNYGAIDVIVTPDDRHVFLEINPGGEFFWLQTNNPKFPFSDAIADVLLGEAYRR